MSLGEILAYVLRDRLVCGLNEDTIQKKLLSEFNLNLEKEETIDTVMEIAENNTADFHPQWGAISVNYMNTSPFKVRGVTLKQNQRNDHGFKKRPIVSGVATNIYKTLVNIQMPSVLMVMVLAISHVNVQSRVIPSSRDI